MRNEDDVDELQDAESIIHTWTAEDEGTTAHESKEEMQKIEVSQDMSNCDSYWISDSEDMIDGDYESGNDKTEMEFNSDEEMGITKDEEIVQDYETVSPTKSRSNRGACEAGNMEERIIDFVKKNAILYNKRLRAYRNNSLKFRLWSNLATMLNSDVVTCKTKWKSLRDRFVRELKKGNRSTKSSKAYLDPWPYFEALSFLKGSILPRRASIKSTPRASRGEFVLVNSSQKLNNTDTAEMSDEAHSNSGPSQPKISRQQTTYEQQDLPCNCGTSVEASEREITPPLDSNTRHKHYGFLEMLRQQLEKFPDDMCDDIKIEILIWVHEKLKELRKYS